MFTAEKASNHPEKPLWQCNLLPCSLRVDAWYVIHHSIVLLLKTWKITLMALLISQMFCQLSQSLEENVANER